jgi:hypothetical protein
MPSTRHIQTCLLAAALAACALPAQAAFSSSHSVALTYLFPNLDTPYQGKGPLTLTGPTDSVNGFAGILNIQFTDNTIRLTLTVDAGINAVDFDGLRFTDLNGTLSFPAMALDTAATTYAQFNASRIRHDGDSIFINLVGLPGQAGQQILLSTAAVPEPGSWALMAGGLALLGGLRRRQRTAPH